MAKAPITPESKVEAPAAPEPVKVEITKPKEPESKLSAQTLAEQAAGREALAKLAK